MEEKEFIKKYGELPLTFSGIYKHRVTMKNDEHKITVHGTLEYRAYITATESVNSFVDEVYYFSFEIES